jgi:DNA-binding FrmR family transcriptional regulator
MRFEYQVEADRWSWSGGLHALHGVGEDQVPTTDLILRRMVEEDRPVMMARFRDHLEHEGSYSCVYRMTDPDGQIRRVMFVGQAEAVAGAVKRLSGIVVDLTEPMREHAREAVAASAEHRAAIEQAKGALMLSFGMDADAAFGLLRTYSNHRNVKLAVLAEQMVAGLADPGFDRDKPVEALLDMLGAPAGPGERETA